MPQPDSGDVVVRDDGYRYARGDSPGRERGARRKKVYGYLKAANELRQTYTAQWAQRNRQSSPNRDYPKEFSGTEEIILFPSYARRHLRSGRNTSVDSQRAPGFDEDVGQLPGDLGYWGQEWEKEEDDNMIVDIDVRGWIYAPQRGPMARRHRLMVALARKLSGIPAPGTDPNSNAISDPPRPTKKRRDSIDKKEADDVTKEEQSTTDKAENDASFGWKRLSSGDLDRDSLSRVATRSSPPHASNDEMLIANARLLARLRPFMASPVAEMPVTIFFFNGKQSQSRTAATDESGHFSLRVALNFVPTHARVLASETLSVLQGIHIIEPNGVSMISDIDDTIKHSAIASGAKEIFRTTFVRDLADLTILGVREWYSELASMDVKIHYVSNAPWQLYPLLRSYFESAGLPHGSFHLKRYGGMLQGIFEPTAGKKKGALEKILRDFPQRRFILVGDSGEADLEVYTHLALAYPGRVLGIFIRDITTPEKKIFFDKSFDYRGVWNTRGRMSFPEYSDAVDIRQALPRKKAVGKLASSTDTTDLWKPKIPQEEGSNGTRHETDSGKLASSRQFPVKPLKPPNLRSFPGEPALQQGSDEQRSDRSPPDQDIRRKPLPVPPTKPPSLSALMQGTAPSQPHSPPSRPYGVASESLTNSRVIIGSTRGQPNQSETTTPFKDSQSESYASAIKNVVSSAYNSLPSVRTYRDRHDSEVNDSVPGAESDGSRLTHSRKPPPVPPPRRSVIATSIPGASDAGPKIQRYLSASTQPANNHPKWSPPLSVDAQTLGLRPAPTTTNSNNIDPDSSSYVNNIVSSTSSLPNKREDIWRRRWERAQSILEDQRVLLKSWRVGSDIQDICIRLVEEAYKEMEANEGNTAEIMN